MEVTGKAAHTLLKLTVSCAAVFGFGQTSFSHHCILSPRLKSRLRVGDGSVWILGCWGKSVVSLAVLVVAMLCWNI